MGRRGGGRDGRGPGGAAAEVSRGGVGGLFAADSGGEFDARALLSLMLLPAPKKIGPGYCDWPRAASRYFKLRRPGVADSELALGKNAQGQHLLEVFERSGLPCDNLAGSKAAIAATATATEAIALGGVICSRPIRAREQIIHSLLRHDSVVGINEKTDATAD